MIWEEINQTQNELDQCLKTFRANAKAYAEAKRKYAVALRQEIVKLRLEGQPVTIVPDMARGEENVANLRYEKDVAEGVWKANNEAILIKKLELNLLKTIYEREITNVQ